MRINSRRMDADIIRLVEQIQNVVNNDIAVMERVAYELLTRATTADVSVIDRMNTVYKRLEHIAHKPMMDVAEIDRRHRWPVLPSNYALLPHQKVGVEWMFRRSSITNAGMRGGILALPVGVGKTLTLVTYAAMVQGVHVYVCKNDLISTVRADVQKFYPTTKYFLLDQKRNPKPFNLFTGEAVANAGCKLVIVSYNTLVKLAGIAGKIERRTSKSDTESFKTAEEMFRHTWSTVICDESQEFCTDNSTFAAVMALRKHHGFCSTATPVNENTTDIGNQLRFCGLIMPNGVKHYNESMYEQMNLDRNVLYIPKSDMHLTLPPVHHHDVNVTLTQQERYMFEQEKKKTLAIYMQSKKHKVSKLSVQHSLERTRQCIVAASTLCTGKGSVNALDGYGLDPSTEADAYRWLRDDRGTAGMMSSKINAIADIIRHVPRDEKVVVYSRFPAVNDLIEKRLTVEFGAQFDTLRLCTASASSKKREDVLERMRTRESCRVMIMGKSGSVGLNLVWASHLILAEPDWNARNVSQVLGRLERIGQSRHVHVYHVQTPGTMEMNVRRDCEKKRKAADDFMRGVNIDKDDLDTIINA